MALTNALKTATTQAFGAFVSTNTTIIDDEFVKDELVSVSSGNIISYQELGEVELDNGNIELTVNVTVSVNNFTAFAKSKGSSCELSGNVLVQQVRLNKLNKKNAEKVIDNLCRQIELLAPYCYIPKLGDVKLTAKKSHDYRNGYSGETIYKLKADIILEPSEENINNIFSLISNTLISIAPTNYSGIDVFDVYVEGLVYKSYIDDIVVTEKLIKALSNMYTPYVITQNFSGNKTKKFLLLVVEQTHDGLFCNKKSFWIERYNVRYIPHCLYIEYYFDKRDGFYTNNIIKLNKPLYINDYWILEESEVENFVGVTVERVQSVENAPSIHVTNPGRWSSDYFLMLPTFEDDDE